MAASDPLVQVDGLKKHYYQNDSLSDRMLGAERRVIRAVDGISFDINRGETFGLVGESGCGKSTAAETVLKLSEPTDGKVLFEGENVFDMDKKGLTQFRRKSQIVFQDPFSSLDPRMTTGEIIREPLEVHDIGTKAERRERARELLEEVGLRAGLVDRYPHEFSGGQRQRIAIARALSIDPEFMVLDEPVSALDVSVQAQILNLLQDLQEEFDLTYLLIAHNLAVVRHVSDRVGVMYLGELVESGPTESIFRDASHPYTEALLRSVPRADSDEHKRNIEPLPGEVPSPHNPPSGCRFHTRCQHARESCRQETPAHFTAGDDHTSACFRVEDDHDYWESDEIDLADLHADAEFHDGAAEAGDD